MSKLKTEAMSGLEIFRIPLVICVLPFGPDPEVTRSVLKAPTNSSIISNGSVGQSNLYLVRQN
jgi:hypothetical protein